MTAALAIALGPLGALACGGGDDVSEDERILQINGITALAANAYAAAGAEGLYDYLAQEVTAACSKQDLTMALEGQPVPEGFVRIEDVQFDGDNARARVVQLVQEGDGTREDESEWSFVAVDESWRISHVPGLERCGG